jgi:hypothetical protein
MCPWCRRTVFGDPDDWKDDPHDADCPAFTPEGVVK